MNERTIYGWIRQTNAVCSSRHVSQKFLGFISGLGMCSAISHAKPEEEKRLMEVATWGLEEEMRKIWGKKKKRSGLDNGN